MNEDLVAMTFNQETAIRADQLMKQAAVFHTGVNELDLATHFTQIHHFKLHGQAARLVLLGDPALKNGKHSGDGICWDVASISRDAIGIRCHAHTMPLSGG